MKRLVLLLIIILLGFFLRVYDVSYDPPGLYIDEVNIGYNAYKILTTGKDQYGIPHPMVFKSFGDYKMPAYIYATSLSMAIFGKNEFAIRFVSILSGTLTIPLLYLLMTELASFDTDKRREGIRKVVPFVSAFLLAISQWHLHFSRGGFEVTLGVFFFLLALWLSVLWYRKKHLWILLLSMLGFVLTIYTYHIFRIITPITVFVGCMICLRYKIPSRKHIFIALITFVILCIPIGLFSLTSQGAARFSETSTFVDYPEISQPLQKAELYPIIIFKNYLSFYSPEFLFNFGDGIGRHQIPGLGLIPYWQLPFLLFGLFLLFRQKNSALKFVLLFLFFISPLAGAIVRPSPHSLRDLLFIIPVTAIIAIGIYSAWMVPKRYFRIGIICLFLLGIFEFFNYLHLYYGHYVTTNIIDWGGEYKQIILDIKPLEKKYRYIYIDGNIGDITPYFQFYSEKTKYEIVGPSWQKPTNIKEHVLYIRPRYANIDTTHLIHTVYVPNVNHDIYAQFFEE